MKRPLPATSTGLCRWRGGSMVKRWVAAAFLARTQERQVPGSDRTGAHSLPPPAGQGLGLGSSDRETRKRSRQEKRASSGMRRDRRGDPEEGQEGLRGQETAAGRAPIGDSPRPRRRCVFRQAAFLAAFRITACLSTAAQSARIGRRRHYHWLEQDPDYRLAFEQAKLEVVGELEDEAVRRACEGWLKPVFYQGRQCGTVRRYSDKLLMFLLKGWRPERYRLGKELGMFQPTQGTTVGEHEIEARLYAARRRVAMDRRDEVDSDSANRRNPESAPSA